MKQLLVGALLLLLPVVAQPATLMAVVHPRTQEAIYLTDEKGDCPTPIASDGTVLDSRRARYEDPRDGEKLEGCYVIDTRHSEDTVLIILKRNGVVLDPVFLPTRVFKPAI